MLKGSKTKIRPMELADLDILQKWFNDQEINLWSSGGWPLNTMFSNDILEDKLFTDPSERHRYMILNDHDEAIGTIGFDEFNIPARSASLFITLGEKNFWGQGYGTDALIVFVKFLFNQWNLHRLTVDTWDGNERAIKTYQKVGFQIEGRQKEARYVLGQYHDSILLGLLKRDFLALCL